MKIISVTFSRYDVYISGFFVGHIQTKKTASSLSRGEGGVITIAILDRYCTDSSEYPVAICGQDISSFSLAVYLA